MKTGSNIFVNKKILIYGLGKSGLSTFQFLKNKSHIYLYDDYHLKIKNPIFKKNLIDYKNILKLKFDQIILSPGIDINKCKLSKYLKKNNDKIYSDLDVFYEFYKNKCITITGTNGKSNTCQLLYEVLLLILKCSEVARIFLGRFMHTGPLLGVIAKLKASLKTEGIFLRLLLSKFF